jgi:hypothetical protein
MRNHIAFIFFLFLVSCNNSKQGFESLSSGYTGVDFNNYLEESEDLNVLNYTYFYNGGGVAIGDLNNDGLPDLVFTGNMVRNKIFLNKGEMKFEDITTTSGIADKQGWCTGVTLVDINNDGWLDIYICRSADVTPERRANLLFINNRNNTFTEQAAEYGLADQGYSTQSAFFDYDRDGDLDCVVINHSLKKYTTGVSDNPQLRQEENPFFGSRLYRNDAGRFTDVSKSAGIISNVLSFGLGVLVNDFNADGWPDFFISNDFNEPDYLFINQQNGTFKEEASQRLTQHSLYSMGADANDIDHDGLPDLVTLDMLPESNYDQKMHSGAENFEKFRYLFSKGFHNQYSRNMLHLNNGSGIFSEIGQLTGISNTDWSWSALLKDFDNDGESDLFVTNGYVRDYTDMDFIKYSFNRQVELQEGGGSDQSMMDYIKEMPGHPLHNYMFRNAGRYQFQDVSQNWGFDKEGIYSGASAGDLDLDGDLDLVLTVTNGKALLMKNNAATKEKKSLRFSFKGEGANLMGIGTAVEVYANGVLQKQEHHISRGFQSALEPIMHFGMGTAAKADSVRITWPDGKVQVLKDVQTGNVTALEQRKAVYLDNQKVNTVPLFASVAESALYVQDRYQTDFTIQPSLNNFISNVSPVVVLADFNGDGNEELVVGATRTDPTKIFSGSQVQTILTDETKAPVSSLLVHDINADGKQDLIVGRNGYGSGQLSENTLQLYLNVDGRNFRYEKTSVPEILMNIGAMAVDKQFPDGNTRIFIGSRVRGEQYPLADPSRVLIFSSEGKYLGDETLPGNGEMGMVTGAVFCDVDGKAGKELVTVGEFRSMQVMGLENKQWKDQTSAYLPKSIPGWWNTLAAADLDGDGDEDLIAGNYGLNTQFKVSDSLPMTILYKDFDGNGKLDAVTSYFINGISYPSHSLDDLLEQMPSLRKRFDKYAKYAKVTTEELFTSSQKENAAELKATEMRTLLFENKPGKPFVIHDLPIQAQFSPVFATTAIDIDKDGKKDLLLFGNQSGTRIKYGKYDANRGFVFRNLGGLQFSFVDPAATGISLTGDVRSVATTRDQQKIYVGINGGSVSVLKRNK